MIDRFGNEAGGSFPLQTTTGRKPGRTENQGVSIRRNVSDLFRNRLGHLPTLADDIQPTSAGLAPTVVQQ